MIKPFLAPAAVLLGAFVIHCGASQASAQLRAGRAHCDTTGSPCPSYSPNCPSMPAPDGEALPTEEPTPAEAPPGSTEPDVTETPADYAQYAPAPRAASSYGLLGSPNAMGDFYGSVLTSSHIHGPIFRDSTTLDEFEIPNPATSVVGRVKATENNSPIPTDRVFLDYAAYNNVPLVTPNVDIQRFTPGFEKTFIARMMSVELRMPLAQTMDNEFVGDGPIDGDSWEIGNLYVAFKTLLYQGETLALTSGLGINTPTADDLRFTYSNRTAVVENEAVHFLPYFGLLHTPNDTFYSQAYVQVDVDANGNPILVNGVQQAVIQDQTLLYADAILGAWLHHNPYADGLQGVVGTTELHYTTSVKDFDDYNNGVTAVDAFALDDFDYLTAMAGIHLLYAGGAQVTFGYGLPLLSHRFADGEFRMMLNWGAPIAASGAPSGIGSR